MVTKKKPIVKNAKEIYLTLKNWGPLREDDYYRNLAKIATESGHDFGNLASTPRQIRLMHKIALATTQEEFEKFAENNEIPAIKLEKHEMEELKGGFFLIGLGIIALVVGVVGSGVAINESYEKSEAEKLNKTMDDAIDDTRRAEKLSKSRS